jgi:hypothetical protein
VTDAAAPTALLDAGNTASSVGADTACRSRRNLDVLKRRGLGEQSWPLGDFLFQQILADIGVLRPLPPARC